MIELETEYEVLVAANGREALEIALAERPSLILMDLHMPVMDGYETTRRLKEAPQTADIPVIAVTASHVMSEDHEHALAAGCVDYLQKPISRAELLEKIHLHASG